MKINILHICNLDEVHNMDFYLPMISSHDIVIFYADRITKKQYKTIGKKIPSTEIYFQCKSKKKTKDNLTMQRWLELLNHAEKTMTWK